MGVTCLAVTASMLARPALRQIDGPAVAADAADTMQPVLAAGPDSGRCRPSTLPADARLPRPIGGQLTAHLIQISDQAESRWRGHFMVWP